MKKTIYIISALLVLLSAPVMSSCNKTGYSPDGYACDYVQNLDMSEQMIDTPSKIIYQSNEVGLLVYYSKADKKSYIFCSDPLCNHADLDCPAAKFADVSDCEYCNGKLYGKFENTLYCVEMDASGTKEIYTAGYTKNGRSSIFGLSHYNQYLYFKVLKDDLGYDLYRYDTIKGKTVNLTENAEFGINDYFFGSDCVYFKKAWDGSLFKAGLDMNGVTELPGVKSGAFDGTYTYGTEMEANDNNIVYKGIYRDNLEEGTHELIYEEPNGLFTSIVLIDKDYIYFFKGEMAEIGKEYGGSAVNFSGGKLWRMDKDGENCRLIWDDITYDISGILCSGDEMFFWGNKYNTTDINKIRSENVRVRLVRNESGDITGTEKLEIVR